MPVGSGSIAMSEALDIDVDSMDELTEEQLDAMSSEQLMELVQALSEEGPSGPEPITATTATQLAYARSLLDEFTLDGDAVDAVIGYLTDEEDEADVSLTNETFEYGRREAWYTEIFLWVCDIVAQTHDADFEEVVKENASALYELAPDMGREGIGKTLTERGHDPDEIEENPNAGFETEDSDEESEDAEDDEAEALADVEDSDEEDSDDE